MATHRLRWLRSYQAVRFDTPDGDLHEGQFARFQDGYVVRQHPETNAHVVFVVTLGTEDLTEVAILDGQTITYDEYELPGGRIYRESTSDPYSQRATTRPICDKSDEDIEEITKDDHRWP